MTHTHARVIHEKHESCDPPRPIEKLVPALNAAQIREHILQLYELYDGVKNDGMLNEAKAVLRDLLRLHPEAPPSPVWVLSTGRCGTLALQRLLEKAPRVFPLHRNCVSHTAQSRMEAFYTIVLAAYSRTRIRDMFLHCYHNVFLDLARAITAQRQFCMLNHSSLAWAPFIAVLFPDSRFIYLKRSIDDTFLSFYTKDLYFRQLEPVVITKDEIQASRILDVEFCVLDMDIRSKIAWYLWATESFASAFLDTLPCDRRASVESESLFRGDDSAFQLLSSFVDVSPLSVEDFRKHYAIKSNEKSDLIRITLSDEKRERLLNDLRRAIDSLKRTGRVPYGPKSP